VLTAEGFRWTSAPPGERLSFDVIAIEAVSMRYVAAESVEEAVGLLSREEGARVLAGGTDLIVQMRSELIEPAVLVDVKKIAAMRTISEGAGRFLVGAAVSGAEQKELRR
jgi:carbon-monoxide dehydrogenase medium subunit